MLQAIKELGELKLEREGRDTSDLLSILVQDPNHDGRYPKVLVTVFEKKDNVLIYSHIRIEDTSQSKVEKYIYCPGGPQGPDITPTAKITEINKFFQNKVKGWFKRHETSKDPLINGLKTAIVESEAEILKDLFNKLEVVRPSLKKNQGCLFTLAIEEESQLKYIGDFSVFKDLLILSVKEAYQKITKIDHTCAVCGEKKNEVYGKAIPIPFYTLDKPGYIAGGFCESDAWKNAPVCLDCSLKINEGKKFLDTNLKQKMGGQRYYLIPKFIHGVEGIEGIVDTFFNYSEHPDMLLRGRTLKRITEDEKDIFEALRDLEDVLTYNFLFFSAPKKVVFKINLLVEDILPSRIATIFEAKSKADEQEIFKSIKIKKGKYENVEFRFDGFRRFAPSQKVFLEVVNKTFRGINLEPDLLFSWFMTPIRQGFVYESYLKPLVLQAFVSLLFFKALGILSQKEHLKEGGKLMTDLKEKGEYFFKTFSETFLTSAHKAVFLLGVLAQKLINIQYQERNSTPFRKNLKGLKMQEEDFKGLLPKIQNKLEEYRKNYYRSLESLISVYFLQAGRGWRISTDELNFYFILGMNLGDEVDKALGLAKEKEDSNA
jgi:CRISPR-associated protein Csh1